MLAEPVASHDISSDQALAAYKISRSPSLPQLVIAFIAAPLVPYIILSIESEFVTRFHKFGLLAFTTLLTSCIAAPPILLASSRSGATPGQIAQVSAVAAAEHGGPCTSGRSSPPTHMELGHARRRVCTHIPPLPFLPCRTDEEINRTLNEPIQWAIPGTDKRIDFTKTNAALPTSTL